MTVPSPHIVAMAPYALANMEATTGAIPISLSQNECLRPPSPRALAAAVSALGQTALYPDPEWGALRDALGERHDVDPSALLCGTGSLDLIGCLARVYAGPLRAVLAPAHAYPFFRTAALMAGARFDISADDSLTVRVDALLEGVRADTGLVFVANPGNPTGTRVPKSELVRLREGLREDILLVVDEAYGEFADHLDAPCFDMVAGGNTVVLRTLSKAYGMAGFRVGWGVFPGAVAGEMRKVLNPNNISSVAQACAVQAVNHHDYMRETCAQTAVLRDKAAASLAQLGFDVTPSLTNFVLFGVGGADRAQSADAYLRANGVFLRAQAGAGLPGMLRMTVAPQAAMDAAIAHLTEWKREVG